MRVIVFSSYIAVLRTLPNIVNWTVWWKPTISAQKMVPLRVGAWSGTDWLEVRWYVEM